MNNLKRWRLEKMQCSVTFEAPIKQKMIDHIMLTPPATTTMRQTTRLGWQPNKPKIK